jgi:hypothetical protein
MRHVPAGNPVSIKPCQHLETSECPTNVHPAECQHDLQGNIPSRHAWASLLSACHLNTPLCHAAKERHPCGRARCSASLPLHAPPVGTAASEPMSRDIVEMRSRSMV